jgi:hypothetical protein
MPEMPAPKLQVVRPATVSLFYKRPAKYIAADGRLVLLKKNADHETPPEIGRRALHAGCAVPLADPIRRKLHGMTPPLLPDPAHCDDLGAVDGAPQIAPAPKSAVEIRHSAFEETIGAPVYGVLPARPPTEAMAVGARKLGEES